MLNLHEVIELENKWKIYSSKKKKKKYIFLYILAFIIFVIFIFALIYFAYSKGASELETNVKKSNNEVKKIINDTKVKLEKEKILDNKNIINKPVEVISNKPDNDKKLVDMPKQEEVNTTTLSDTTNNETISLSIMNIDVKNSSFKSNISETKSSNIKNNNIIKNIPKNIETNTIVITDLNSKATPKVESKKELDDLEYLKLKFSETNSIYFALDIADVYYSKGDFKNAREWALTANKLDVKNDKSWVMFAKASYKLGLKEQAINSLTNYLNSNSSTRVKQTLDLIKEGKL
ncbi:MULTISPECIES: CDC27 family protein [unclassified Campylobacter]|uniref:CDC27 family protein n=1 Tax=unclassified Campylobacter TaxID=2593542 RepID=UPI001D50C237|nr:CDC27 family protein [Campylobacter sp. RM9331]MBZ8006208.1 CDC27 family protein [Campylobacter sp. RM9332]